MIRRALSALLVEARRQVWDAPTWRGVAFLVATGPLGVLLAPKGGR